jgi:hypothetical protein
LGRFSRLQSSNLSRVATKLGATRSQVAIAWLLKRAPNMLPVPGTSSSASSRKSRGGRAGIARRRSDRTGARRGEREGGPSRTEHRSLNPNPIHSRVALVTSASRGLGRSTALALAQSGVDVIITYRTQRDTALEVTSHRLSVPLRVRVS